MKYIPFKEAHIYKTKDIIEAVCAYTDKGINVKDMRQRCRILEALEKCPSSHLLLEDADFALLKGLLTAFPFSTAHPALLGIIDEILEAKEPPVVLDQRSEESDSNRSPKKRTNGRAPLPTHSTDLAG